MLTQKIVLSLLGAMLLPAVSSAGPLQTVFTFSGYNGANPGAGLLLQGANSYYGTTIAGGVYGGGTVFRLNSPPVSPQRKYVKLQNFNGNDGAFPGSGLVADAAGALYGTTSGAGSTYRNGYGTIYRIDPITNALTILWGFTNGADGSFPNAGLLLDGKGAAYGTTTSGAQGYGTIYKIDLASRQLTTVHTFSSNDGAYPYPGLVFDSAGQIWGVAPFGGLFNQGVLYTLNPATGVYTVVYDFGGASGGAPEATLTIGPDGTLYGTTAFGGNAADCVTANFTGCGVVFKYVPATATFSVLHTFTGGADGGAPEARLVFDKNGQLTGTTYLGGLTQYCTAAAALPPGCGTVFRIDPSSGALTTLHAFTGAADGGNSFAPVVFDAAGDAVGVTNIGGDLAACPSTTGNPGCGTVFRLEP